MENDFRKNLNVGLMNKLYDIPLYEHVVDSFRGIEILPNVQILDFQWVPEEDRFDWNDHVIRRNTNKNKLVKHIAETRCGVLYLDVAVSGIDNTGKPKVVYLKKPIMVPIQDENGYYRIKGKDYFLIYQLVDKMMYPSLSAVTIKSLMPICTKTSKQKIWTTEEQEFTVPIYNIQIFKSAINILLIYSHMAITKSLMFMEVHRFIKILRDGEYEPREGYMYFKCGKKSDIVVEVMKEAFDEFIYVKSITGALILLFDENKTKYIDIDNWEYWMMTVGGKNTIKRGIYQHIFFNRLLDDVTRKELKINEYDKQNIYYLLRWIIQNYHDLWQKDNLSMINKRLRCNEYLGSLMTAEISKKINRLVSLGDRATLNDYLTIFKFPEDIFLTKLYGSGVLRFNEINNDMDFKSHFKFTKKGPNSLGGTDNKRIPVRQRILHPSMIGYIDIAETSTSDPGQGGSLSPWCDMKSMYFDDSLAENKLHFQIKKFLDAHPLEGEWDELIIHCDTEEEYNKTLDELFRYTVGKIKIYGVANNDMEIIVEKDPREGYRTFDEKFLQEDDNAGAAV
jgi:hypothetical protein